MKNYSHFLLELSLLLSSCFWRAPIGESKWHGRSRYLDHLQLGDYIDPALIKKFEKETGYKVNYETFDSNEAMYTKIQQGGTAYDIAIPSEYMIQK